MLFTFLHSVRTLCSFGGQVLAGHHHQIPLMCKNPQLKLTKNEATIERISTKKVMRKVKKA